MFYCLYPGGNITHWNMRTNTQEKKEKKTKTIFFFLSHTIKLSSFETDIVFPRLWSLLGNYGVLKVGATIAYSLKYSACMAHTPVMHSEHVHKVTFKKRFPRTNYVD